MAVKRAIYLCNVHLRELIHTPILYAYLCLFFVYYHHLNAQIVLLQQETGIRVNAFGYTVGVFSNYQSTIVFGLGAVMIFSDLPLIRNNALFESTRCTRNVWVGGRILYIICVSIIYTLVMTSLCLLTCHGKFEDPFAWGKLLNTFASGFSLGNYSIPIELSFAVTGAFNPLQAFGIVIVMCIMCSIFIGLFVLVLSLCFGKMIALLSASVLAVMDFLIVLKLPFWWYHLSPLSFTRLSIICNSDMPYYPTIAEGIATLFVGSLICALLAIFFSHMDKRFSDRILQEQY